MSYKYTLTLTEKEDYLLHAMWERGYDCGVVQMLDSEAVENSADESADTTTYHIPEHVIWPVHDEYQAMLDGGNDPWGPFVAETLRPKLDALMSEVV